MLVTLHGGLYTLLSKTNLIGDSECNILCSPCTTNVYGDFLGIIDQDPIVTKIQPITR